MLKKKLLPIALLITLTLNAPQATATQASEVPVVSDEIAQLCEEAAEAETTSTEGLVNEEPMNSSTIDTKTDMGVFKCTFYCGCSSCTPGEGITASGTTPTEGRTIAADTSILPMGTHVYIEGMGEYVVEDTGSAIYGNVLDIYLTDHNECYERGIEYREVYIIN